MIRTAASFALCAAMLAAFNGQAETPTGLASISVPDGFTVENATTHGLSSYPMFMEFDEDGNPATDPDSSCVNVL